MVAVPDAASYVASKHAVVGLTKALAVEWGQHNIRVNAVCPGLTWTDMPRAAKLQNPAMYQERERRIPLGRAATTLDQARAILYLASPEADSVHGLIMNVDGGNVAMSSGSSVSIDTSVN
jgi:NAD(P)-dependent dehydrogenase (short-subunit alcohol dehydrogenase family)